MSPALPTARDPVWLRLVERLGLPTLYAVVMLRILTGWVEGERADRRDLLAKLAAAVEAQTVAVTSLATEQRSTAAAITATWPRLRIATLPPRVAATGSEGSP